MPEWGLVFTFSSITDKLKLSTKMERRSQVYKDVSTKFWFLNNLRLNEEEYSRCCNNFSQFLPGRSQHIYCWKSSAVSELHPLQISGEENGILLMLSFIVQDQIRSVFSNIHCEPIKKPTNYSAPVGVPRLVINPSVCASVSVSISLEPLDWSSQNFVCGSPVAMALRYVMYFRFYGWRHVWP